jgi:hypothetical protein
MMGLRLVITATVLAPCWALTSAASLRRNTNLSTRHRHGPNSPNRSLDRSEVTRCAVQGSAGGWTAELLSQLHDRVAGVLPGRNPAVHVCDVRITEILQRDDGQCPKRSAG